MKYQNPQHNIGNWTNGSYMHAVEMKAIDVIFKRKSKGNDDSSLFTAALPHAISRLSVTSPWYFHSLFPKIWSYTLDGKLKMIFLKKYTEIWYFLQTFWKDGYSKEGHADTWSFLYYLERLYFFPENMIFFPWSESERRSFSENTWKHDALPSSEEKQET